MFWPFLPSSCHHRIVLIIILLFAFLKIPRGKNSYQPLSSCIFLPIFWPTISELTHRDQLAAFFALLRPFRPFSEIPRSTVRFRDSTNYHAQSPTKTICSEVFFWVCFGFLRFSFTITVLSCFVPHSRSIIPLLRFRLFQSDFFFHFFFRFCKYDFVLPTYQITYIVSEYVYF